MRIRFLKNETYDGIKTGVVDGIVTVDNIRFSFEYGQIVEIRDYILNDSGTIDIIFLDDSIATVGPFDVELSEPSSYSPQPRECCKK